MAILKGVISDGIVDMKPIPSSNSGVFVGVDMGAISELGLGHAAPIRSSVCGPGTVHVLRTAGGLKRAQRLCRCL